MRLASEYPEELVTKVQYECILEYIFSAALQPHKGIKIYQIDPLGLTSWNPSSLRLGRYTQL